MSKNTLKPISPAELIIPGQPSNSLLEELKSAGARLTTHQIATALQHLEHTRARFVTEATATGILLLAKKETLKHGEWQAFAAEVWAEIRQNGSGAADLPRGVLDSFTRSLRVYCFCAQHFLAGLEQGFAPEDRDMAVPPPDITPKEALALATLPEDKQLTVYAAIERFVAGRSLRRMLMDFRRAEGAADQEEAEEARRKTKKPAAADPAQMDFFDDMKRPLDEIDRLMEDTAVRETVGKQFWLQLAGALETQAKHARELAKEANP